MLGALTQVSVVRTFKPPTIGQVMLVSAAKGSLIATKVGTPHLMGVAVDGGQRSQPLKAGMQRISITGTTSDGHPFTM